MDNSKFKEENENSPIMQYAIKLLHSIIENIKSGECSEKELIDSLYQFNPEKNGYFREDEFVNYDEAGQLLHLGWNRQKLNDLCKKNGIKTVKIKNRPVGFHRKDILKLKQLLKRD